MLDPDTFITIAFGFEVVLFTVAAALYVAHEVRKTDTDEAVVGRVRRAQRRLAQKPRADIARALE